MANFFSGAVIDRLNKALAGFYRGGDELDSYLQNPVFPGTVTINGATWTFNGAAFIPGSQAAVTAAGTSQGTAAAITTATAVVSGADGTKGVILPTPAALNQEVTVVNTNATNALKVYPDAGGTGGTINGGSANASVNLAAAKGATYVCTGLNPTAWWSASN